ncbi:MAG: Hsp33 family molecular chaperone HslO [Verrucomicrobiaceae bacterium]|nr:Hsp33 family molecular chaperone HslO [Verrucomicrobiaceae bacterium]
MPESPPQPELSFIELRSFFVRGRNALLVRGKFQPLYIDYYLHLMQHGLQHPEALDEMLKDSLAALALHLCSRPQDETVAWTVHVKEPRRANLFVTGSTHPGRITGRLFIEDVKKEGEALFIAQTTRPNHPVRQSMIDFHGADVFRGVETFYTTSEQRLTRLFRLPDEEFVQISAEPDCDEDWLAGITLEDVLQIGEKQTLTLLETRGYQFECGCSMERLLPIIGRLPQEDLDHIFEDGVAQVTCPRCAAVFRTTKAQFQAWQAQNKA